MESRRRTPRCRATNNPMSCSRPGDPRFGPRWINRRCRARSMARSARRARRRTRCGHASDRTESAAVVDEPAHHGPSVVEVHDDQHVGHGEFGRHPAVHDREAVDGAESGARCPRQSRLLQCGHHTSGTNHLRPHAVHSGTTRRDSAHPSQNGAASSPSSWLRSLAGVLTVAGHPLNNTCSYSAY